MRKGSIRHNVVFAGFTNFSDTLVFALMVLAARELGKESFGVFAFAQALALLHLTFMNFGLNPLVVREVARDRSLASRYLFNVVWWKAVLAGLSLLVLAINTLWLMELDREAAVATGLVAGAVAFRSFSMTARCVFQALGQFERESLVVGIEQGLLLVIGAGVLLAGGGVVALAGAFLVSRGIGCLVTFALTSRSAPLRAPIDLAFVLDLQKQAVPIGLAALVTNLYLHADTLILTYLTDFANVGLYNTALKVFIGLMLLPSIVCHVWLPRLSTSIERSKHEYNSVLVKGVLMLAGMSTMTIVIGVPLAGPMMRLVFGPEYTEATVAMQILLAASMFTFQNWFLRVLLVAINRRNALLTLSVIGLILRVGLALVLIPLWGIEGAAVSMLIAELFVCVGAWGYLVRKHFRLEGVRDLLHKLRQAALSQPAG